MSKLSNAEKELYYWYNQGGSSFSAQLYTLLMKADSSNFYKLSIVFPEEAECVERFQNEEGYWESIEERMRNERD